MNFTKHNFKFSNNILETDYDRAHNVNKAAQAMLSLSSTASPAVRLNNRDQEENDQNLEIRNNLGDDNQDVNSQGENEEDLLTFEDN